MDSPSLHPQMTDYGNELEGMRLLVVEEPVNFTVLVQLIRSNAHTPQRA